MNAFEKNTKIFTQQGGTSFILQVENVLWKLQFLI